MKIQYIKLAIFFVLIISAGIFLAAHKVEAAGGDIVITVHDQFDNPYTDGSASAARIACPGGTAVERTNANGGGDIIFLAADIGDGTTAECDNGEAFTVETVTMDGFVEVNDTSLTTYSTAIQNNSTVNLLYAHKINVVDELGNPITPTESRTFDDETICFTIVDNAVYCAIIVEADNNDYLIIPKDGYVTSGELDVPLAGTRGSQTAPQIVTTMTTSNGLKFSHKVNIVNELGAALTPDTVTAGSFSVNCSIVTSTAYCPVLLAHDNNPSGGFAITKDGYVEQLASDIPLAANRTAHTDAQQVVTMTSENGLEFGHKVIGIKDELGNDITPDSVQAGTGPSSCVLNGNTAYCPVTIATDTGYYIIHKDGYVGVEPDMASDRSSHTDPQSIYTLDSNYYLFFGHTVSIKNQLNGRVTADSVTAGASDVTCTIVDETAYCPVAIADDNNLDDGFTIVKSGFVTKTVPFSEDRTDALYNQASVSMNAFNGLLFAVRVNLNTADATVVAGNGYAISCQNAVATQIYYCPVPLADIDTTVKATASGFSMGWAVHEDRTLGTDSQQVVTILLQSASGGSSGGGFVSGPPPAVLPSAPIEQEIVPPAPTKDIVTKINEDAALVFAQTDPISYFKQIGTDTTFNLGSGERAAAISSFEEAYGKKPATLNDWIDILNIANGRWPLTVNKEVEARAYLNFRAVYGRNADMKNSTDVNALKMMGYGVRSTKPRDLTAERIAIAQFKTIFGFNPTTARHWNIMRAIAYSGATR